MESMVQRSIASLMYRNVIPQFNILRSYITVLLECGITAGVTVPTLGHVPREDCEKTQKTPDNNRELYRLVEIAPDGWSSCDIFVLRHAVTY